MRALTIFLTSFLSFFLFCNTSLADRRTDSIEVFRVNNTFGDGNNGRIYRKWSQHIQDRPVERVEIKLRRSSGDNNTYVNLRYGNDSTFENGKREYLRFNETTTASWNIDGARPNGKPLVLNAYKGEVYIEEVVVKYRSINIGLPGRPNERGQDRNSYDSRYHDDDSLAPRDVKRRCRRQDIRRPRIDIGKVRASGGLFSGKYRISGSMIGSCVVEAGYFEYGRMKKDFNFPMDDQFRRKEFEIRTRSGKGGEFRILTTDGQEEIVSVDKIIASGDWLK